MHSNRIPYKFRDSYRWYYQIGNTRKRAILYAFLDTKIGTMIFG